MAFVEIEHAWRVTLEGTSDPGSKPWAMVFGVNDTSSHTLARALDIAEVFKDWWIDTLADSIVDTCSLNAVHMLDQASETGVSVSYNTDLPASGDNAGDPAAGMAAVIVTLLTGMRGRANRGRKFNPGLPDEYINGSGGLSLDGGIVAAFNTRYAALITAVEGLSGGPALAVLSYSQALAIPVLAVQTRSYLGTQKRRVRP